MIRLFVVDDHHIVVEGIYAMLRNENGIEVTGFASNGMNCLAYLSGHKADVLLLDISLPDSSGVDICRVVREKYPGTFVLAMTTYNQQIYIRKILEHGGSGYLLKDASKQELVTAINTVAQGKVYVSAEAGMALRSDHSRERHLPVLTKREKEVLAHVAEGMTNAQIAARLFISSDTVDTHRKNLHIKLNVKNTAMLVRYAIEQGLL